MLQFKTLSRCSEPVKFAVFYVVLNSMQCGQNWMNFVSYDMGCMALYVMLFLLLLLLVIP